MTKADILNIEGKKTIAVELPQQFNTEYRPEIIKRAVLAVQNNRRQPYGASPEAGKRASAKLSRRRRNYRGAYGHGISRVPRKIFTRRGTQFNWEAAVAPGTKGGRRAHPPKSEKEWSQKINIKERRKAICSAIAATSMKELVQTRGHLFDAVPLVVDSKLEKLTKTKEIQDTLLKLGLKNEIARVGTRKIRAGKGKSRGRKYRTKKGPLIVVSNKCSLIQASRNILGLDISVVDSLNTELLAPGAVAGRLTIWTDKALERLAKERLFLNARKVKKKEAKK